MYYDGIGVSADEVNVKVKIFGAMFDMLTGQLLQLVRQSSKRFSLFNGSSLIYYINPYNALSMVIEN